MTLSAVHLVPDFAIVIFGLFKQTCAAVAGVINLESWQNSPQLSQNVLFVISQAADLRATAPR